MWKIRYTNIVLEEDVPKLDTEIKERIKLAVEKKLTLEPLIYGNPLRAELFPLYKLRVGDWRVVYRVIEEKHVIEIVAIAHRREVYRLAKER